MASGGGGGGRRKGRCKWFNVVHGYGFITPSDGGTDVFVHQSAIQMPGFRSLGEDEEVEFESKASDKGVEATFVCGPSGTDCRGSERRPVSKKKLKKIRCYNCGEFGKHLAAKCPQPPLPKRCYICKSGDHLIADCPYRDAATGKDGARGEGPSRNGSSPGPSSGPGPGSGPGSGAMGIQSGSTVHLSS